MRKVTVTCDVCGSEIPPREDWMRHLEKSVLISGIRTNHRITFDCGPDSPPDLCDHCALVIVVESSKALSQFAEGKLNGIEDGKHGTT